MGAIVLTVDEVAARATHEGALRILYVEDDADMRELTTELLRAAGFEVTTAACAESAQVVLQRAEYDLLLTDHQLPGQNGAWLIREAQRLGRLASTAVMILTGEQHPAGVEGHRVLRKPLDPEALLGAIDEVIDAFIRQPPFPAPFARRTDISGGGALA